MMMRGVGQLQRARKSDPDHLSHFNPSFEFDNRRFALTWRRRRLWRQITIKSGRFLTPTEIPRWLPKENLSTIIFTRNQNKQITQQLPRVLIRVITRCEAIWHASAHQVERQSLGKLGRNRLAQHCWRHWLISPFPRTLETSAQRLLRCTPGMHCTVTEVGPIFPIFGNDAR